MNLPLLLATATTRADPQQPDITVAVIVTWLLAAAALVVPIAGEVRRRPKARVQFVTSDALPVVSNPVDSRVSVAVTVAGRPVQEAFSVRVRIANTGKRSFPASDWASPIYIEFGNEAEVIVAELTGVTPVGARPSHRVTPHQVIIEPYLLNSGDLWEFTFICEGARVLPLVHGRLPDVKIRRRKPPYPPGTGKDGRMEPPDKFIIFGFFPALFLGLGLWGGISAGSWAVFLWFAAIIGALFLFERQAVTRSRQWRAEESISVRARADKPQR